MTDVAPLDAASRTLGALRQTLARLDPAQAPHLKEPERRLSVGLGPIDDALAGGLAPGTLHDVAPASALHTGAMLGWGTILAGLACGQSRQALWIGTAVAGRESGEPYGPGLGFYGLSLARLLMLQVSRPADVLWAMEEGLRCPAIAMVIAELPGEGAVADLTATRRLTLAARERGGLGLLLRQQAAAIPSAAVTRWEVASAAGEPDRFGGLGDPSFILSLVRNRRGPCGRWLVRWNCHDHVFHPAVSLGLAEAPVHRPHRAPARRAG